MWYELMKSLNLTFYLLGFIYVPFNLHIFQYFYVSPNLLSSSLKYDFTFEVNYGFRHLLWCLCVTYYSPVLTFSFLTYFKKYEMLIIFSFWQTWNSKFSVRINVKWLWTSRLEYRGIVSPPTRSLQNKQNTWHSESKTPVWRTNNFQEISFSLVCVF